MKISSILPLVALGGAVGLAACGSNNSGPVGGPVAGALDMHCGDMKTQVGMCIKVGSDAAVPPASDGGADDGGTGGGTGSDFGATMDNAEGDDDDCKYHVVWTSSPVRRNTDVTFDLTVIRKFDNMPATGADVTVEAFLNDFHPTPTSDIPNMESAGGKYHVGPMQFDAMGDWTVRFHFYETCSDAPDDSPHGHAAFFVRVP
jgi:hypothetical protein